ncbi:MAG: hypothetical protein PHY02_06435 [Phycisphaerae bacterium]|nr:hypothetical protein [Phycisphaerae bacterium]
MSEEPKKNSRKSKAKNSRAEIAESEIIETQEAAALFVGRNARTIRRWEKEGMLTAGKDGKKVYIRSQLKQFAEHEGKKSTKTKLKKEESEANIKATRDERERIQLEILKKEWVKKADYDKRDVERIQVVKKMLLNLPRKAVPLLRGQTPARMQEILKKEVIFIIDLFANYKTP